MSFFLLAPYIAVEAASALAAGDRAETSVPGLVLTAGTAILEPGLGVAKRRIGARLGSAATAGEGTQNLLCAYLADGGLRLAANTLLGAWWLDPAVALGIAEVVCMTDVGFRPCVQRTSDSRSVLKSPALRGQFGSYSCARRQGSLGPLVGCCLSTARPVGRTSAPTRMFPDN